MTRFIPRNFDFEQKIYYVLSRDIKDYENFHKIYNDKIDNKQFIEMLIPNSFDVLDYTNKDLKFYIDKASEYNITLPCTIIGRKLKDSDIEYYTDKKLLDDIKVGKDINIERFIISDWLYIEPFIKYLRKKRKGEQHKICTFVLKQLGDNWDSTLKHNTNEHFKQLQTIYKFLKIQNNIFYDKYAKYNKAQMYPMDQFTSTIPINDRARKTWYWAIADALLDGKITDHFMDDGKYINQPGDFIEGEIVFGPITLLVHCQYTFQYEPHNNPTSRKPTTEKRKEHYNTFCKLINDYACPTRCLLENNDNQTINTLTYAPRDELEPLFYPVMPNVRNFSLIDLRSNEGRSCTRNQLDNDNLIDSTLEEKKLIYGQHAQQHQNAGELLMLYRRNIAQYGVLKTFCMMSNAVVSSLVTFAINPDNILPDEEWDQLFIQTPLFKEMAQLSVDKCYQFTHHLPNIIRDICTQYVYRKKIDYAEYTILTGFVFGFLCKFLEVVPNEAQMFTRVRNLPNTFNEYGKCFERGPKVINQTLDSVDGLSSSFLGFSQNFTKMNTMVKSLLDKYTTTVDYIPLFMTIAKIVSAIYLIHELKIQSVPQIIAMITLILPTEVVGNLVDLLPSLSRALKGIVGRFSNRNVAQVESDHDQSIISSFFSMTKMIMSGLVAPVDSEKFKNMTLSNNKIKLLSEFLRSAGTIGDYLCKLVSKIIEFIGDGILKYYGYLPEFLKESKLELMISRYNEMVKKNYFNGITDTVYTNRICAQEVIQLHFDLQEEENRLFKKAVKYSSFDKVKIFPYLRVMIRQLEKIVTQIPPHVRGDSKARRVKPYWLYIHGSARVGKSSMFQNVIVNELVKHLKLRDKYEDPHNYSYFRNCGDEYWDKYRNQIITQYNDICQNFADEEAMNIAVMELTNIIDDAPYPLNMSYVDDKNMFYFTSEIVVSNSQVDFLGHSFITSKCLSGGEHLFARRNIVTQLILHKKYTVKGGIEIDTIAVEDAMTQGAPVSKYVDIIPKDMYLLKFTDPLNGRLIKVTPFDDGIAYILDHAKAHFARQHKFKDELFASMARSWAQMPKVNKDRTVSVLEDENLERSNEFVSNIVQQRFNEIEDDHYDEFFESESDGIPPVFANAAGPKMDRPIYTLNPRPVDNRRPFTEFEDAPDCVCKQNLENYLKEKYGNDIAELDRDFGSDAFSKYVNEYFLNRHCIRKRAHNHCIIPTRQEVDNVYANILHGFTFGTSIITKVSNTLNKHLEKMREIFKDSLQNIALVAGIFVVIKTINIVIPMIVNYFTPKNEAESHEGSNRVAKKRIRREKVTKNTKYKATAHIYTDQNVAIENLTKSHMASMTIFAEYNGKRIDIQKEMHVFCVCGSIFLMPRHFWHRIEHLMEIYMNTDITLRMEILWDHEKKQIIPFDLIDIYLPEHSHATDVVYFRVRKMIAMRDLRHLFIRENDDVNLHGCYLYGLRSRATLADRFQPVILSVNGTSMDSVVYSTNDDEDPIFKKTIESREYYNPTTYVYYDGHTLSGDCGMLLLHSDSKLNCRLILGIHTAGNSIANRGFATPVYVEDIDEAIEYFNTQEPVIYVESTTKFSKAQIDTTSRFYEPIIDLNLPIVGTATTLKINGKERKIKANIPCQTKISRSVVFDDMEEDFGPHKFEPARLAPFRKDGELISPFLKGLKKLNKCSQMTTNKNYNEICQHMYESVMTWHSPYLQKINRRVLDWNETINGIEGLNQLDIKTSPGFPYTYYDNTNGKLPWFDVKIKENGSPMYTMRQSLLDDVIAREEKAKKGIISETLFIDTLKDETRPLEKVESGSSRIFQIGPMDLTVLMRKYFGAFIAHCHLTSDDGEVGVGINANSISWTILAKRILTMSKRQANGDFEHYDASLNHQIASCIATVANLYYDDGPENALIRYVLVMTCLNSFHLIDVLIIMLRQSNPSGNVLTTLMNCFANMFLLRLAFITLTKYDLSQYHKFIRAVFYGDDNWEAISERILREFNMFSLTTFYKSMGMVYTPAIKNSTMMESYGIDDSSYLKRRFVQHPRFNLYLAQLDKDVILEIARWSESDPTNMNDQMNRFNSSLMEMANYGPIEFTKMRKIFSRYCIQLKSEGYNIEATNLFHYEYVFSLMYPEYSSKHLIDLERKICLTNLSMQSNEPDSNVGKLETYIDNLPCIELINENHNTAQMNSINPTEEILESTVTLIMEEQEPVLSAEEQLIIKRRCVELAVWALRMCNPVKRAIRKEFNKFCHEYITSDKFQLVKSIMDQVYTEVNTMYVQDIPFTGIAQMERIPAVQNMEQTQSNEKVSTFMDDGQVQQDNISTNMAIVQNPILSVDLDSFLERPFLITNKQWLSSMAYGVSFTDTAPYTQLIALDVLREKLKGIQLFRPDIEITIRLNATMMHYGSLIFGVYPLANVLDNCYKEFQNVTSGEWYQINANGNQTIRFVVPYRNIANSIALGQGPLESVSSYFHLKSWVSVPLSSANGTAAPVTVHIYARFLNLRLSGYSFRGIAQMPGSSEAIGQTKSGIVPSTVTSAISDFASVVSKITLNPIAGAISSSTRVMTDILKHYGFSSNYNLQIPQPVNFRPPRMLQIEDTPVGTALVAKQDAQLAKDFSLVNGYIDESDIIKFCSRPFMIYTGKIESSRTYGANLWSTQLSPHAFINANSMSTVTDYYSSPIQFVARFAQMWRGSFKFHISFKCSSFHSCRVRLFWDPSQWSTPIPNYSPENSANMLNIVMDINESTDYSFTIPYNQQTEWLATGTLKTFDSINHNNGKLFMQLLTPLTSASATVEPIYFQVFVSAGEDFQIAAPTMFGANVKGTFAQMSKMENNLVNQIPSCSYLALQHIPYPVLGDVPSGTVNSRRNTPFEITSLRQLCTMPSRVYRHVGDGTENRLIAFDISGQYGMNTNDMYRYNYLLNIMPVFAFNRGSYRITALTSDADGDVLKDKQYNARFELGIGRVDTATTQLISVLDGTDDYFSEVNEEKNSYSEAIVFTTDVYKMPLDITVPHYDLNNCRHQTYYTNKSYNSSAGCFIKLPTNTFTTVFTLSAGDDFILGCQLNIPKSKYVTPAVTSANNTTEKPKIVVRRSISPTKSLTLSDVLDDINRSDDD